MTGKTQKNTYEDDTTPGEPLHVGIMVPVGQIRMCQVCFQVKLRSVALCKFTLSKFDVTGLPFFLFFASDILAR